MTLEVKEMQDRRLQLGQCIQCGGHISADTPKDMVLCPICHEKLYGRKIIALLYKNKGGLFRLDVKHMCAQPKYLA